MPHRDAVVTQLSPPAYHAIVKGNTNCCATQDSTSTWHSLHSAEPIVYDLDLNLNLNSLLFFCKDSVNILHVKQCFLVFTHSVCLRGRAGCLRLLCHLVTQVALSMPWWDWLKLLPDEGTRWLFFWQTLDKKCAQISRISQYHIVIFCMQANLGINNPCLLLRSAVPPWGEPDSKDCPT